MGALASLRNLVRIPEVRRRIFWTLGLLAVFRLGSHIPLPGLDPEVIRTFAERAAESMGNAWAVLQVISGGAIGKLGVFTLGIGPYITASILVQLFTKVSGRLEAIAKEGASGQRKLQRYTRYATAPIALVQSTMAAMELARAGVAASGVGTLVPIIAALTAGSLLVLWMGDQITERGIGNGPSILIMGGILSRGPAILLELLRDWQEGLIDPGAVGALLLVAAAALAATLLVSLGQRRIPLQHARHVRGRRMTMASRNYLPLRLNSAGVMPVIFASCLFVFPQAAAWITGKRWILEGFRSGGFLFTLIYTAAIVGFAYLWTYLFFPPSEIAHQLREAGSFVPGIRPGETTRAYLDGILSRITLGGAVFLAGVALLPDLAARGLGFGGMADDFLGGTSLLIVVGVSLDLLKKFQSHLDLHHYQGFLRVKSLPGR